MGLNIGSISVEQVCLELKSLLLLLTGGKEISMVDQKNNWNANHYIFSASWCLASFEWLIAWEAQQGSTLSPTDASEERK